MTSNPLYAREHTRALAQELRDRYGVTATLTPGGKHRKLHFSYQGREYRIPVSGTPSDHRATNNAIREIHRLLGEPPPQHQSMQPRTLEEMTQMLNTKANDTFNAPRILPATKPQTKFEGGAANYSNTMRFSIPEALVNLWGADRRFHIKPGGPDMWEFVAADDGQKFLYNQKNKQHEANLGHPKTTIGLFGKSPAEFVIVDNTILVSCPIAARIPLGTRFDTKPTPEPKSKLQPKTESKPTEETERDRLVKLLANIRDVEANSEYRLIKIKDTGEWAFQHKAPIIR